MIPLTGPDLPPVPEFIFCADCASTVSVEATEDHKVMVFFVLHSPTCPAWSGDGREVGLALGPDDATVRAALATEG